MFLKKVSDITEGKIEAQNKITFLFSSTKLTQLFQSENIIWVLFNSRCSIFFEEYKVEFFSQEDYSKACTEIMVK